VNILEAESSQLVGYQLKYVTSTSSQIRRCLITFSTFFRHCNKGGEGFPRTYHSISIGPLFGPPKPCGRSLKYYCFVEALPNPESAHGIAVEDFRGFARRSGYAWNRYKPSLVDTHADSDSLLFIVKRANSQIDTEQLNTVQTE
jgi:hypothetical protein